MAHRKGCFLTTLFYGVAGRRGPKKAAVAVAHRILVLAYHVIRDGSVYQEMGGDYIDRLRPERTAERLTRRLEQIGYQVVLTPSAEPVAAATALSARRERGLACTHAREPRRKLWARAAAATHGASPAFTSGE